MNKCKLYVEEPGKYANISRDWFIDEEPGWRVINQGIILPWKSANDPRHPYGGLGGVCDAEGVFVEGHKVVLDRPDYALRVCDAYPITEDIECFSETVVYCGVIISHWGHFVVECLSRMWWLIENESCQHKLIFIVTFDAFDSCTTLLEYFYMLGIEKERIVLLRQPTRFDSVIVPSQSSYIYSGYKRKAMKVYDAIRDSVEPAAYKKVYFTRTKLHKHVQQRDATNEEYFEDYFRKNGFEIIAPEKLPIKEQLAIAAGAQEIACVFGSLHHHALFAQAGIKLTLLCRVSGHIEKPIFWINQAKKASCILEDVSANFLPRIPYYSAYFLAPNRYWDMYRQEYFEDYDSSDRDAWRHNLIGYIEAWIKTTLVTRHFELRMCGEEIKTLTDFITFYCKYVLDYEIDEHAKVRLNDVFTKTEITASDRKQKILYGAGHIGWYAHEYYGDKDVFAFSDKNKFGEKYYGKSILHPFELYDIQNQFDIVICIKESQEAVDYFESMGISNFYVFSCGDGEVSTRRHGDNSPIVNRKVLHQ